MDSISFCIITDGKESIKSLNLIASIRTQEVPHYEILISGRPDPTWATDFVTLFAMPNEADSGNLGKLRNVICEAAKFPVLVVLDDDYLLHDDWYQGLLEYGGDFDVLGNVIYNPDGSRYWDWKAYKDNRNWLLEYDDLDNPDQSLSGGLCVMKRYVFDRVQWAEDKGFYQGEDIDFSARVKAAGFRIGFNPHSVCTHDDPRYSRQGWCVIRE